ncbi:MAG: hypothetical protein AAF074_03270 [Pseudomonadota bacterium]
MPDLTTIKTQNLRALVEETEERLEELRGELERREEAQQHSEIDRLDEHMKNAELSIASIRDFISKMLEEMRGNASKP